MSAHLKEHYCYPSVGAVIKSLALQSFLLLLLKKTSILIYGRAQTANLHGEKWADFLDSKTEKTNFQYASYIFSKASYMTKEIPNDERDLIINLTKKWIQTHA